MEALLTSYIPENRFEPGDRLPLIAEVVDPSVLCVVCSNLAMEAERLIIKRSRYEVQLITCLSCFSQLKICCSLPSIGNFAQLNDQYKKQLVDSIETQRRLWMARQTPMWSNDMLQIKHNEFSTILSPMLMDLPTVLLDIISTFAVDSPPIIKKDQVHHCVDMILKWCHATIVDVKGYFAHVRYVDWDRKWDEWIEFYPVNTRLIPCDCPGGRIRLHGDHTSASLDNKSI